jgi:hypothetical protein
VLHPSYGSQLPFGPCTEDPTPEPTERPPRSLVLADKPNQQRGEEMKLWEVFNSDVSGIVFWPIMIVMLGILIPIVMAIR